MWAMSSLLSKEGEGGDPSRFFRKHKLEELALLEVRIPEDELANLKADMEQAEDYQFDGEEDDWQAALEQIGDVRFDKKIPASWLKVVPPQELEAAATKLGYDRPVSASAALEDMYYKNEDGRAHITIGDAASFADAEGAAADLQYESGLVAYLHDIESAKPGGGTRLMQHLLADLKRRGVETVALQPIGYARKGGTFEFTEYGDPGHDRLVRFYERFGFKIKPDEHPYNNPVMYLSMSRPVSASADRHSKAQEQKHWLLNKGCIAWAKAYKDIFGGKLFDVVEPEPNNTWALYPGMPHHVVVKTKDGVFHDATGPYANEQELLSFWEERRARAGDSGEKLVLEPHNGKRAKDQGLVARKSDYDLAYSILSRKP